MSNTELDRYITGNWGEDSVSNQPDYDTRPTFNDVGAFGEIIRSHFDGMIDIASDGEIQQVSDEGLVVFNGYGFRVHLSNGASFDIQIQQRDFADEEPQP